MMINYIFEVKYAKFCLEIPEVIPRGAGKDVVQIEGERLKTVVMKGACPPVVFLFFQTRSSQLGRF